MMHTWSKAKVQARIPFNFMTHAAQALDDTHTQTVTITEADIYVTQAMRLLGGLRKDIRSTSLGPNP